MGKKQLKTIFEVPQVAKRHPKTDLLILARLLKDEGTKQFQDEEHAAAAYKTLVKWADLEVAGRLAELTEKQLQGLFLAEVFGQALGYTLASDAADVWNLEQEYLIAPGQTPDAVLGKFRLGEPRSLLAVVELKGPQVHLDRDRSNGLALLIDGIGRALFPNAHDTLAFSVLVFAIALTGWVQYARTVRGSTMVERNKEYVQAARVIGVAPVRVMCRHVLPNVLGLVLVLATIQIAGAIITEATLSFLGVGVPPTSPSLGTLIRVGQDFLFSGEWWITIFPGAMLVLIALSVNLLGDWLRDALNPRLR